MKYIRLSAALAAAALAVGAANISYAQTRTGAGASRGDAGIVTNLHKADDKNVLIRGWNVKVGDVDDADIVGADGKKIGSLDGFLANKDGQIVAAIGDIGGFLGLGKHDAVIQLNELTFKDKNHVMLGLTKDEAKTLPEWKD